jgi:ribosomal protein L18E
MRRLARRHASQKCDVILFFLAIDVLLDGNAVVYDAHFWHRLASRLKRADRDVPDVRISRVLLAERRLVRVVQR